MPQKTDLNVSPYFDDYKDPKNRNYYQVLFKPGYPVQARELTTLQSILQNQIEKFGSHIFKDGARVIDGEVSYNSQLQAVILENEFSGTPVDLYLYSLVGTTIRGQSSNIKARVNEYVDSEFSDIGNTTLYVTYLSASTTDDKIKTFIDGEQLVLEESISFGNQIIQAGEPFAIVNSTTLGSAIYVENGVYFTRGRFVTVYDNFIFLDQYGNNSSYKVGFRVVESFVTSDEDILLNDNAQGFSNYAAPGADRLKITLRLEKVGIDVETSDDFILLKEIKNGVDISITKTTEYSVLSQEFARRTFDESGNYFTKIPNVTPKETLNNFLGNKGLFTENQLTYNGNVPSDDIGTYAISPMKAYIRGYEVEKTGTTYIDFNKPRTTKTLENQEVNYSTGPTFTLNRVYGTPIVGLGNTYFVSLRDERVGETQTDAPGDEIGLARVYDFALESGSYDPAFSNLNQWDITLYDIQTYANLTLNEPITLSTPTHIRGNASGATGFLRYDVNNSGIITAYNISGKFSIGEKLIFDGVENTRVTTKVSEKSLGDAKSIYGIVGSAYTFTGDIKQTSLVNIGSVNISAASGGISTVTYPNTIFSGIVTTGNLVSFTDPGSTDNTYAKVESVSQNTIQISGITTVSGICEGALPTTEINPTDFKILVSELQRSSDNTLYTPLPKSYISSVDLTDSNLIIRKQIDVTITSNSTGTLSAGDNEIFLQFDEERYALIREDGVTEELTQDKFVFSSDFKQLTINGLGTDSSAKLIATLRKINIKSKIKNRNKVKTIVIDKSKYEGSGIGATTLNDGLTYGNYAYGTRVQDRDICLLYPEVTRLYGIYESDDTSDPELPNIVFTSIDSLTNKVNDILVGDTFVGQTSNAVGVYVERVNDTKISFSSLNAIDFIEGETVTFNDSGITAIIGTIDSGDKNISLNYSVYSGSKNTIYDYSRIIRNETAKEPTKKLKIVFEYASFSESDTGNITTINSYQQFDYCELGQINGYKNSDIIDIRQRVSPYSVVENSRSPFEFLSRSFNASGNSASNVLASDESFQMSYSYYLPRIDRIFLSKEGIFQASFGEPAESPKEPTIIQDSLDIATIYLPPYLCNIKNASVSLANHKRYRMSDIQKLERRIENLEYYTTLSLLESDTSNMMIQDANGINRFKSGFFVDDFSSTTSQLKVTEVKNSIDIANSQLRPTHFTTQTDLLLATTSNLDSRFVDNLNGTGVKRTGQLITLDYDEVPEITQPYATGDIKATPYDVSDFNGSLELYPSSDVWVDQTTLEPKTTIAEGNYTETIEQLNSSLRKKNKIDPQTGFGPVIWDSWETVWTGTPTTFTKKLQQEARYLSRTEVEELRLKELEERNANRPPYLQINNLSPYLTIPGKYYVQDTVSITNTLIEQERTGTKTVVKEAFDIGASTAELINSSLLPYVRKRNVEMTAKRMKPLTRLYTFFDGVDINVYVIPKLLEISMISGVFEVGETVIGSSSAGEIIRFRVAQQNHKYGSYDNPIDIFTTNPYESTSEIPSEYSQTSTILNVDTYGLSNQPEGNYFGYIVPGLKLKGQTSGAEANLANIRLVTDNVGTVIASFWIPDPNIINNPKFEAGTKPVRLTDDESNSLVAGNATTSAEANYYAQGTIETIQENIMMIRNAKIEYETVNQSRNTTISDSTVIDTNIFGKVQKPRSSSSSSSSSSERYVTAQLVNDVYDGDVAKALNDAKYSAGSTGNVRVDDALLLEFGYNPDNFESLGTATKDIYDNKTRPY